MGVRLVRAIVSSLVLSTALSAVGGAAHAGTNSAPLITLDHYEGKVDQVVVVRLSGFTGRVVTVAMCGNEGRRGSADCAMAKAVATNLEADGTTEVNLVLAAPPAPCPCIVRAATSRNDEVATVGLTMIGLPSAPVVGSKAESQPIEVAILAEPAPTGLVASIKSELGGSTAYDVTLSVKNRTAEAVSGLRLEASAGHYSGDTVTDLLVTAPASLAAGATWRQVVRVRLPAPVQGSMEWRLTASGVGPTVTAVDRTLHRPVLLYVVIVLLVLDVWVLVRRARRRRRTRRHGEFDDDLHDDDRDDLHADLHADQGDDLVGAASAGGR